MRLPPTPLLLAALLGLSQCKKSNPDPVSQLPPATQTGANTFGCLVNGQPWTPSGNDGLPNSVALYDPGINSPGGAQVNIAAYRIGSPDTYMNLYCGPITPLKNTFTMAIPLNKPPLTEADGCYEGGSASFCGSNLTYLAGQIVLTRVDEKAGIIAGTFWFSAVQRGRNDTLKVTQGRFDYKI
ncbi:hypothetical protein A0257_18270 [Hymenobacter psoromatis]|nr:hypothetical protein A0257_18270 [Hymenobacter psoromatis]